ncbi:hypothetical protein FB45DRAFT_301443 [Roridomyces roridus]|uniref:F-box domain-containing protein n=1 Tax=Roridomyces roridus TaxID=1738132 RepID=A0AAD7FYT8_9AGAR|nr:hypothetical protein FB45DRAFT_301443 [Roridomyces roridus]
MLCAIHLVAPGMLRSLTLDGSSESAALLEALAQDGACTHLRSLTITVSDTVIDPLLLILECCPALETLQLSGSTSIPVDTLPPSTAPALRSFTGPHAFAKAFTTGRSLVSVHLLGFSTATIRALPATLRTLSVEVPVACAHKIIALVSQRFSALEELTLTLLAVNEEEEEPLPDASTDAGYHAQVSRLIWLIKMRNVKQEPFAPVLESLDSHPFSLPPALVTLRLRAAREDSGSVPLEPHSLTFPIEMQRRLVRAMALAPSGSGSVPLRRIVLGYVDGDWVRLEVDGGGWREIHTGEDISPGDE